MNERATSLLSKVTLEPGESLTASGSYIWFGVVFATAGIGACSLGFYLDVVRHEDNAWMLYAFGLMFVAVGGNVGGMKDTLSLTPRRLVYTQHHWRRSLERQFERSEIEAVSTSAVIEGDTSKPKFQVSLKLTDVSFPAGLIRLSQKSKEIEARNLAEMIADHLKLPLLDMNGESHSWKPVSSGKATKQPENVAVSKSNARELVVSGLLSQHAKNLNFLGAFMLMMSSTLFGGIGFLMMQEAWFGLVLWSFLGLPGLYFVGHAVIGIKGREVILINDRHIERHCELGSLNWGAALVELGRVRQVRAQPKGADVYGVVVIDDERRRVFGTGLDEAGLVWLADRLVESLPASA